MTTYAKDRRSTARMKVVESLKPWTSRRVLEAIIKLGTTGKRGEEIVPCGYGKTWEQCITREDLNEKKQEALWFNVCGSGTTGCIVLPFVG